MATATRRLLPTLLKTLAGTTAQAGAARGLSTEKAVGAAAVVGSHTAKWMQVPTRPSSSSSLDFDPVIRESGAFLAARLSLDSG